MTTDPNESAERTADAAEVTRLRRLETVLHQLGFVSPRPVLVLVGGASGIAPEVAEALVRVFEALVPRLAALGCVVVDGATDFGVMRAMGLARSNTGASLPLLGVAAAGTVDLSRFPPSARAAFFQDEFPGRDVSSGAGAALDPNHSHFLIVPGDRWGDESPWISDAATILATGLPALTLVVAGGDITRLDVRASLRAHRPLVILGGSGGTADILAEWCSSGLIPAGFDLGQEERALAQVVELGDAAIQLPPLIDRCLGG